MARCEADFVKPVAGKSHGGFCLGERVQGKPRLASTNHRVNHDILMSRLAKRINDKRLLKIIRRFLEAGMMKQGVCIERVEGMPQGGPLSPLMSNLLLDEVDKELEKRGHKFCRYADDQNIYVRSKRAGERVLQSIKQFLWDKLKLRVNESKSASAEVKERQFFGYRLLQNGKLLIADHSVERVKNKIRGVTKRNRGVSLEQVIAELNVILRGWINYFQLVEWPSQIRSLDEWVRRKLRCYRLKQRKRSWPIAKWLISLGLDSRNAWNLAKSSKAWWRLSSTPQLHQAMSKDWFDKQGLLSMLQISEIGKSLAETAVRDIASTVV